MRYKLSKWGSGFLATRDRGREVREDIEQALRRLSPGETLILDFSDIDAITVSFGDECVAKLLLARNAGDFIDRGIVAEELSEDVHEALDVVLDRRKLALISPRPGGDLVILGDPGWLEVTLRAALRLQSFRAADLADALGITAQAANNRLRLLVASGAVTRERIVPEGGGKEFAYKAAVPEYA